MLYLASILITLGLVAIYLGIRGTRLAGGPFCAECRFDLQGHAQSATTPQTCPECGQKLTQPWHTTDTARSARKAPIAWGSLAIILGLTGLLASFGSVLGIPNTAKPTAMLLAEARWGPETVATNAMYELTDRVDANRITHADIASLAKRGFTYQRRVAAGEPLNYPQDPSTPPLTQWCELLDDLYFNRALTKAQEEDYIRTLFANTRLNLPARVLAGTPIEIGNHRHMRINGVITQTLLVVFEPTSITIDGQRIDPGRSTPLTFKQGMGQGYATDSEFLYGQGPSTYALATTLLSTNPGPIIPRHTFEPGPHTIRITWALSTHEPTEIPAGTSVILDNQIGPRQTTITLALEAETTAFASVEDAIEQVRLPTGASPVTLNPEPIKVSRNPGNAASYALDIPWNLASMTAPPSIVASITVRAEGEEFKISPAFSQFERVIKTPTWGELPQTIHVDKFPYVQTLTLILTPQPERALTLKGVDAMYADPIVIENIELDWSESGHRRAKP